MKAVVIVLALALCLCNSQSIPGGYSQVSASNVQSDAVIQSLAQSGADSVVKQALSDGKLPNSNANFKLTKINNVYQQVVNGINYRFNVTLTNANNGAVLNAVYIIYYQPSTKAQQLTSLSYQVAPSAPVSATTGTTASTPAATSATNTSASATSAAQAPAQQVGGYTLVPANQVQSDSVIQSLAKLGAQNIAQQAAAAKKLPTSNSNFSISKINSVYKQVVNGINYKFDVTLTNSDGVVINANYVIYYQPSTKASSISSSSYAVASYPAATAATTSSTPATTSTSAPTQAAPGQTVGGYTTLAPSDYENNSVIQSLAAFGAQNITQKAIADKKVPANSVFTVSKINSVSSQVVNGINYNFNVNLSNADKSINIVAAYIIYYQSWTNTRRVLASNYVIAPQ